MAIQIKLKNSVVQDSTPSTSDLPAVGEIALNANINSIGGFMRASDNTIVKIFGPGSLSTPTATTTVSGISELATNSETTAGSATNRVVTPAGLNAVTVAERSTSNTNYVAKAGSTLTGVLTMPNGSNSAPAINFGDSDSGIFGGTNTVSLAAGGTTRLTADTGVSVTGTLAVTGAITSTSDLTIADKIIHAGDTDTAVRFPAADTVSVETGGSEAIRVDSSGRLLVGTSTSRSPGGVSTTLQVEGTSAVSSSLSLTRNQNNNNCAILSFAKTRGNSTGTTTIVQDDDRLGDIMFAGADGTDIESIAAKIQAFVDGTPGANDMPGRLVFSTTADGAASPTERLRIDSSGNVGIGTTSPSYELVVAPQDTNESTLQILAGGNGKESNIFFGAPDDADVGKISYDHNGDNLKFVVNTSERMRITSTGSVGIGTTGPNELLEVAGNCRLSSGGATRTLHMGPASAGIEYNVNGTTFIQGRTDAYPLAFKTQSAERMRIDSSGQVGIGVTPDTWSTGASITVGTSQGTLWGTGDQVNLSGNAYFNSGWKAAASKAGASQIEQALGNIDFKVSGSVTVDNAITFTNAMRVKSDGKVGIGTTSPSRTLTVRASDCRIRLEDSDVSTSVEILNTSGDGIFTTNGSTNLIFKNDNTERMRIDSSGRVLAGSTSTANSGRIQGFIAHGSTAGESGITSVDTNSMAAGVGGEIAFYGKTSSSGYNYLGHVRGIKENGTDTNTACALTFHTRPTLTAPQERMRIDSSGRVGIGTSSLGSYNANADNLVIVDSGHSGISIQSGTSSNGVLAFTDGANTSWQGFVEYEHNGNNLKFGSDGDERMRIDSSGNVGIGTSSPVRHLHLNGSDSDTVQLHITNSTTGTTGSDGVSFALGSDESLIINQRESNHIALKTADTERVRITSDGLLGINNSASVDAQIDIQGNSENKTFIRLRSYQGGAVVEHWNGRGISNSTDTGRLGVGKNGNALIYTSASASPVNVFAIGNTDQKPLVFSTGNTERVRIDASSPSVLIGTTTTHGIGWTLRGAIQPSSCNYNSTDIRGFIDFSSFHSTGSAQSKIFLQSDGKIYARTTTIQAYSSERRTKKNIVALNLEKAWNTLRDTPFYTFNFKDEIEGTALHHGPIVDECPEDLILPTQKEDEVGVINTVNSEKLQYRAYSALQQALKRIEELETKVAALEAA